MYKLKTLKKDKKGMSANAVTMAILGIVLVVLLITSVAPTVFNGADNITGAPDFFDVIYPIMIAIGLIMLFWRAVSGGAN